MQMVWVSKMVFVSNSNKKSIEQCSGTREEAIELAKIMCKNINVEYVDIFERMIEYRD